MTRGGQRNSTCSPRPWWEDVKNNVDETLEAECRRSEREKLLGTRIWSRAHILLGLASGPHRGRTTKTPPGSGRGRERGPAGKRAQSFLRSPLTGPPNGLPTSSKGQERERRGVCGPQPRLRRHLRLGTAVPLLRATPAGSGVRTGGPDKRGAGAGSLRRSLGKPKDKARRRGVKPLVPQPQQRAHTAQLLTPHQRPQSYHPIHRVQLPKENYKAQSKARRKQSKAILKNASESDTITAPILEVSEREFKITDSYSRSFDEKVDGMQAQMGSISSRMETLRKKQKEVLDIKTLTKMKVAFHGLINR